MNLIKYIYILNFKHDRIHSFIQNMKNKINYCLQRGENAWIAEPPLPLYGEEMEMVTTYVTPVVFTTKWTEPTDPLSNQKGGW